RVGIIDAWFAVEMWFVGSDFATLTSQDSQWIAFFADGTLRKIAAQGGVPEPPWRGRRAHPASQTGAPWIKRILDAFAPNSRVPTLVLHAAHIVHSIHHLLH